MLGNMKTAVRSGLGIGLALALMAAISTAGATQADNMEPALRADAGWSGAPELMERLEDLIYLPGGKAQFV